MSYAVVVWQFLVAFGAFVGMADVLYTLSTLLSTFIYLYIFILYILSTLLSIFKCTCTQLCMCMHFL